MGMEHFSLLQSNFSVAVKLMRHLKKKKKKKLCIMKLQHPCLFLIYYWAEVLTLHLQVFLGLEVLDCRVVHDANDRYAVVLLTDGERQPAGHCVHLVVGQLHSGLPCGETSDNTGKGKHFSSSVATHENIKPGCFVKEGPLSKCP